MTYQWGTLKTLGICELVGAAGTSRGRGGGVGPQSGDRPSQKRVVGGPEDREVSQAALRVGGWSGRGHGRPVLAGGCETCLGHTLRKCTDNSQAQSDRS